MIRRLYHMLLRDIITIKALGIVTGQLPFQNFGGTWSAYSRNAGKLSVMMADDVLMARREK